MEYGNGTTNQLVWRETENRYHNEEFLVTPDNPNVNVAILSGYVKSGDKILDIGCGEGKFGKILSEKKCEMTGVDLDEAAAQIAKQRSGYNHVYLFNVENDEIPEEFLRFKEEKFDKIAMLDVLEHVINPTAVIYNIIPFLKDSGSILISIPNVNNADILLGLLNDKFNYREAGVLDNTHTKYFQVLVVNILCRKPYNDSP
ncbi:MAG: class I SAM-dependent methyltransferase, partial [Lachnospiraceae bacterium]|nr:class I SAM-dependent methyltransferase [Lachnospiraceae bacterium]